MRIDLSALLLVLVVGGCAYVEDKNAAPHQREDQGGPTDPAIAPGQLRPISANFAMFPEAGEEMASVDQKIIAIAQGDAISSSRFVAADHLEVTFALEGKDLGGERAIRIELPEGASDEVEVASEKCQDFRPTYNTHTCIVVLRAGQRLPSGSYTIFLSYAAAAERSLSFTVTR